MNKKLITLAVAAAMTAPAAAFAEATIYGVLHNHLDYVDVEKNAQDYGPGAGVPASVFIPAVPTRPDNIFITVDPVSGIPTAVETVGGGVNTEVTFDDSGLLINGDGEEFVINTANGPVTIPKGTLTKAEDFNGWGLNTNDPANRIGIKGSEDLGGGLKAIYQVELGVSLSNIPGDGNIANGDRGDGNGRDRRDGINMRNSFVGLAGNFGTFLVGRHDTPLKISTGKLDMFADTLADYSWTIGFHDVRADNTVAYISPSFSGFQFAGAVIPSAGTTPLGFGEPGESPEGIADAYSLALIYANGPFYAGGGYEVLGKQHWQSTLSTEVFNPNTDSFQLDYNGILNYGDAKDWSKWRIGLGLLDWNGFSLTGIYESHQNVLGAPTRADMQLWQVQAGYAFGNNTIKAMYGANDVENCVGSGYSNTCSSAQQVRFQVPNSNDLAFLNARDYSAWAVAFDHNFSKRTQAYVLYTATDSDQKSSDWSGFSLGLKHKF